MAGPSSPETTVARIEDTDNRCHFYICSQYRKIDLLLFLKISGIKSAQFDACGWVPKD